MPENPLAHLEGSNVKTDRRHDRQTLGLEQLTLILETTKASATTFRGLAGTDRHFLYLVAMTTGFRAGELATLSPTSFDLTADPPTATLASANTKNKQPVTQPLPSETAEALHGFLAGKPAGGSLWPGTWAEDAADMFSRDLADCGLPYVIDGPDGPLYADFHALRHSFVALLEQTGATLKQAMQLARHSDPKLTMARYGRARLNDLGATLDRMPPLLPKSGPKADAPAARQTGTDGRLVGADHISQHPAAPPCIASAKEHGLGESREPLENRPESIDSHADASGHTITPGRIRTCDLRFRKPPLYPLSYGGNISILCGR